MLLFKSPLGEVGRSLRAKNVRVQKRIAEFALWIVVLQELLKVRQLFVERLDTRWGHRKQLAPMRAGVEWRELFFDQRQHLLDRRPILNPCKVEANTSLL